MTASVEALKPEFNKIIPSGIKPEIIADGFVFTEGPLWDPREEKLLFSDIRADTIYSWDSENGTQIYRRPSGFSNGLTYNRQGDLIVCEHRTRAITITKDGAKPEILAGSYQGKKLNSPNDVIAANDGSILFSDPIYGLMEGQGGPAEQELSFQGLYRIAPDTGRLILLTDSFERPNGLALSPDEKLLYVADTVRQHIRVFDVGAEWQLTGGCVWAELWDDEHIGRPDGMKIDERGNVFCAGPGGIWIFNSQADLIGRIYLPDKTSNLAWGEDNLQTLFITSSSKVYRIRCLTRGIPLIL